MEVLGYGITDLKIYRFVITSNNVAKSSYASGDFNSKVGCIIIIGRFYMTTTFYLMSICFTPLDVLFVRMHPC